jgi:hypothetical protein
MRRTDALWLTASLITRTGERVDFTFGGWSARSIELLLLDNVE